MHPKDILPKAHPVFLNVLPTRYRSWLDFYDHIPEEYRDANEYRTLVEVSKEEYEKATGQKPVAFILNQLEYRTQRQFLLAKIGEELLPSRLRKDDINTIEAAMHEASKYTASAHFLHTVNILTPLWAVAKNK